MPPDPKNWGDRDFIAVGPDGTVYVTWDYGPERTSVTYICASNGSCAFATGDLNVVIQKSTDRGKTWGPMSYVSPGFPASGGDSAPLVVEPNGRIDVLYQGYHITNTTTYTMDPAYSYFTSSSDGGSDLVDAGGGRAAGRDDVAVGVVDRRRHRHRRRPATCTRPGTRRARTDGSRTTSAGCRSRPTTASTGRRPSRRHRTGSNVPHIMEVAGGGSGIAYVSWLSDSNPPGYALYLRAFSITRGWLSGPVQISTEYGDTAVWPGDTIGLSALSPTDVVASWGSDYPDVSGKQAEIYAANVAATLP